MYANHDDPIQGILCASPALLRGPRAASSTNLLSWMRTLARSLTVQNEPPKPSRKVAVQFLASDDYIADPAELLHRFRPLDELYAADDDVVLRG